MGNLQQQQLVQTLKFLGILSALTILSLIYLQIEI